ncbi:MAG: hypothetical protein WC508_00805 [Patescibacteria group bacterium]
MNINDIQGAYRIPGIYVPLAANFGRATDSNALANSFNQVMRQEFARQVQQAAKQPPPLSPLFGSLPTKSGRREPFHKIRWPKEESQEPEVAVMPRPPIIDSVEFSPEGLAAAEKKTP